MFACTEDKHFPIKLFQIHSRQLRKKVCVSINATLLRLLHSSRWSRGDSKKPFISLFVGSCKTLDYEVTFRQCIFLYTFFLSFFIFFLVFPPLLVNPNEFLKEKEIGSDKIKRPKRITICGSILFSPLLISLSPSFQQCGKWDGVMCEQVMISTNSSPYLNY